MSLTLAFDAPFSYVSDSSDSDWSDEDLDIDFYDSDTSMEDIYDFIDLSTEKSFDADPVYGEQSMSSTATSDKMLSSELSSWYRHCLQMNEVTVEQDVQSENDDDDKKPDGLCSPIQAINVSQSKLNPEFMSNDEDAADVIAIAHEDDGDDEEWWIDPEYDQFAMDHAVDQPLIARDDEQQIIVNLESSIKVAQFGVLV